MLEYPDIKRRTISTECSVPGFITYLETNKTPIKAILKKITSQMVRFPTGRVYRTNNGAEIHIVDES